MLLVCHDALIICIIRCDFVFAFSNPDSLFYIFVLSHFRDVYRCARSSDWGDQVPIIPKDNIQTDSEWYIWKNEKKKAENKNVL